MKDFARRASWSAMDKLAATLSALGISLYFAHPYIGRIEGRHFPVVGFFEVQGISSYGAGTKLTGTMSITRPRCNFHHIEWYLATPYRRTLLGLNFMEGAKVRPGGWQDWGPWVLDVPMESMDQTVAVVFHQCPYRPWLTQTHLYP